ncbi:MAG: hypothetical protein COB41_10180 [Proteobacteria bacterium]|nr:MAG: hypothetical protein COB41_10180 [Pseudomonadota bacterium]
MQAPENTLQLFQVAADLPACKAKTRSLLMQVSIFNAAIVQIRGELNGCDISFIMMPTLAVLPPS